MPLMKVGFQTSVKTVLNRFTCLFGNCTTDVKKIRSNKVVILFNRSKTPTPQCLIICTPYIIQDFRLVMCLFINIYLIFQPKSPQNLPA